MTIIANGQLLTMPSGYLNRYGSSGTGYQYVEYSGNTLSYTDQGILYQWGSVAVAGGSTATVTFPLVFSTYVSGVLASIYLAGVDASADRWSPKVYSLTTSGFTVRNTNDSAAVSINWLAIGA